MKKLILAILFSLTLVGVVKAGQQDRYGNNKAEVTRSSVITTTDLNMNFLTTGTIVIRSIHVTSAVANSWLVLYKATATSARDIVGLSYTTAATFQCSALGQWTDYSLIIPTATYLRAYNTGEVHIGWDYLWGKENGNIRNPDE